MSNDSIHIPLFPLNILLLPGEQLPLHVFEERYQQLFSEAKKDDVSFGLPFTMEERQVSLVSECRLVRVTKEYETGESDVVIEAIRLGELTQFETTYPGKLYPGGFITYKHYLDHDESASPELLKSFKEFISLKFKGGNSSSEISYYKMIDVAASIGMSNEDKVKFLKADNPEQQEIFLLGLMKYLGLLHRQENSIENGLILN